MQYVSVDDLLTRATPYEDWRAPLNPRLRRAVILSGVTLAVTFLALWFLPQLWASSRSLPFLVLGDQFWAILTTLYQWRPWLIAANLVSAALYVALLIISHGLAEARPTWHWAAFVEVVLGALNGFILTLEVTIIVINLLLLLLVLIIIAVVLVLGLAAAGRSRN